MSARPIVAPGAIELASGGTFPFQAPWMSEFTVEDVAKGLSQICRFTGQCERFYSVAEHSVHCSYIVPKHLELTALCHDAAEAFLGDVSQPLKALLPDYKALESLAEAYVLPKLGARYPLPADIKRADVEMLALEKMHVLRSLRIWPSLAGVNQAAARIEHWDPETAAKKWLERYAELGGDIF